jgi:hypothetical protein
VDEERYQRLEERWQEVREEIREAVRRAGRDEGEVSLVAVSKLHQAAAISRLHAAGQLDFGENYVQECVGKMELLEEHDDIRWHFIGHLQTNKARFLAGKVHLIHTLASKKLAATLSRKAQENGAIQDVLIQVNLARETQKNGVLEEDFDALAEVVRELPGLRWQGLMVMPPFFDDPERARPVFVGARKLLEKSRLSYGLPLPHLSMGMTGDFVPAVEEGATLVRIGTRIFGPRP